MRQKKSPSAAATCTIPGAILFDEPLNRASIHGESARSSNQESVRAGRKAAAPAIVISSHLLSLVEDLCTHLLILERGRSKFLRPGFPRGPAPCLPITPVKPRWKKVLFSGPRKGAPQRKKTRAVAPSAAPPGDSMRGTSMNRTHIPCVAEITAANAGCADGMRNIAPPGFAHGQGKNCTCA